MKKLFALAIVAGMVFVGCTPKADEQPPADETAAVEAEAPAQDEQTATDVQTDDAAPQQEEAAK